MKEQRESAQKRMQDKRKDRSNIEMKEQRESEQKRKQEKRKDRSNIEMKEQRESAQKRMQDKRKDRSNIEMKEQRESNNKRKHEKREKQSKQYQNITNLIDNNKVLSFRDIQLMQQIEHERQQNAERLRFFRQQKKEFTISKMLIPFNVLLRKNSRKLQGKQPRGKYMKQTYIRTKSAQKPKHFKKTNCIQSKDKKNNAEQNKHIITITEELYKNNSSRGIYYELNNKIPLIIHDTRLTAKQKRILLLTKNTNNLDPTVYTNSDLELIRKLKLRNLPRTLRELIIEESIVMFLVKNNVYTKKSSSTMNLHPNSLINIMINEQKCNQDNPYKQKMTYINIISDERLTSEQKGILLNSVKFDEFDKSHLQSNEIQRINELYETFATIPTDQLVLENKKQTVRDIFLNINLFYNRYSILVQDNKILNINKRKDEEIRNKELNNNNNNDYNNSKKQHKNNKILKKTNNKIMKGNNKHMYKKNKLIHKKHIQSKDRINNNNELKYDNNDNLNKSETQQSKNKDLKINMKQNITSKNNKDNNINSIENNNQNINEKKSHKNKNNENDQSYKKLDNDDSSDYNIEDLDLPKPLSVTEIENMIDNDIRLDIRLNNEQKGILLNEIRFKDINTKHINQITLNEIKNYIYILMSKKQYTIYK